MIFSRTQPQTFKTKRNESLMNKAVIIQDLQTIWSKAKWRKSDKQLNRAI
jgi:hypothetical protein